LRAVLDSVECSLADRAATILGSEEPEGGVVDRQGRSWSWGWRLVKDPGKRWVQDRDDALEPISLHSCRHSFVSFLIASGADLKTLTSVVGHSDIRTTLNVYGHLLEDSLSVAADRLDAYLAI
jgi:integrase